MKCLPQLTSFLGVSGIQLQQCGFSVPRLGLVRAMLMCADILLLDEPTGQHGSLVPKCIGFGFLT